MTQQQEALRYASLLGWGTRLGVFALIASFAVYVLGVLPPHVPLEQLPRFGTCPWPPTCSTPARPRAGAG